jgi:hypothetical protein
VLLSWADMFSPFHTCVAPGSSSGLPLLSDGMHEPTGDCPWTGRLSPQPCLEEQASAGLIVAARTMFAGSSNCSVHLLLIGNPRGILPAD